MRNLILTFILLAIIALSTALYFLISHFSAPTTVVVPQASTVSISPMQTQAPTVTSQTEFCQKNQLSGTLSSQGAAGNIYAKLELINTGKTPCEVVLGNTVYALFTANNILSHSEQSVVSETFIIAPGAKVYSQVHYPNGPQCQSGITPKPITFVYKSNETSTAFVPDTQTGNLMIQACKSEMEKTTIDIWPLSETQVTP
jgi:hypothetical protein